MAKFRLLNLQQHKSLLDLLVEKVATNLDFYIPQPCADWQFGQPICHKYFGENGENISEISLKLPHPVIEKILKRHLSQICRDITRKKAEFTKMKNGFAHLLNSRTKEVDLQNLLSFCPSWNQLEEVKEVLQLIEARAPNVESLAIQAAVLAGHINEFEDCHEAMILNEATILAIGGMERLNTLRIRGYKIGYSDLKSICKKSKNLVNVDVALHFYESEKFELESKNGVADFIESFSKLKSFLFQPYTDILYRPSWDLGLQITSLCMKHLPFLESVRNLATMKYCCSSSFACFPIPKLAPTTGSYALRHLCVSIEGVDAKNMQWFPNITHLMVRCALQVVGNEEQKVAQLCHFSKVESLILHQCLTAKILDRFLNIYGENLHTFYLINYHSGLEFKIGKIFKLCPKLENLLLVGLTVTVDSEPQINFFNQLKHIQCFNVTWTGTFRLSNMLSAPKLEYCDLGKVPSDLEDLKELATLMKDKKILRKLRIFRCKSHAEFYNNETILDNFFLAWSELTKNALAFLPELIIFETPLISRNVEKVVTNIDSFISQPSANKRFAQVLQKYFGKNCDNTSKIFSKLPHSIIEEILKRVLSRKCSNSSGDRTEYAKMKNRVAQLLNSRTIQIDLNNLMSFCPATENQLVEVTEVLELIQARAPNVESLAIEAVPDDSFEENDGHCNKSNILNRNAVLAIGGMEKLKTLRFLGYRIRYSDFKTICRNIKSLTHVNVDLHVNSFPNLKSFLFRAYSENKSLPYKSQVVITRLCLQHLPLLEAVLSSATLDKYAENYFTFFPIPMCAPTTESYSLRHLCIYSGGLKAEDVEWFPNVTHLMINCFNNDESKLAPLCRFSKVESLILQHCHNALTTDRFLKAYGANLHTFCLINPYSGQGYELGTIFNLCPKLETLILVGVKLVGSTPFNCANHLKFFKIKNLIRSGRFRLSNVLSSPKLEHVDIQNMIFKLDDLKELSTLIKNKRILRNLQVFRCVSYPVVHFYLDDFFHAWSEITKNALAYLPKLVLFETPLFLSSGLSNSPYLRALTEKHLENYAEFYEKCYKYAERIDLPLFVSIK
ncbi:Hypothetical predicted protein [Cloeon dipterum]|uniref:F-box domain-containing protein n=1 Tax=Cloeon dipterum TaxID=197152 RepID=A0A8S1DQ68_9INSE|nr:Hypothetical predicted protein [Cloeon dipterum]